MAFFHGGTWQANHHEIISLARLCLLGNSERNNHDWISAVMTCAYRSYPLVLADAQVSLADQNSGEEESAFWKGLRTLCSSESSMKIGAATWVNTGAFFLFVPRYPRQFKFLRVPSWLLQI